MSLNWACNIDIVFFSNFICFFKRKMSKVCLKMYRWWRYTDLIRNPVKEWGKPYLLAFLSVNIKVAMSLSGHTQKDQYWVLCWMFFKCSCWYTFGEVSKDAVTLIVCSFLLTYTCILTWCWLVHLYLTRLSLYFPLTNFLVYTLETDWEK